jgi:hypothetical protein
LADLLQLFLQKKNMYFTEQKEKVRKSVKKSSEREKTRGRERVRKREREEEEREMMRGRETV